MKNFYKLKLLFIVAIVSLFSSGTFAQLSCYNIIGYFPSWIGTTTAIDYSKYTIINYAFGIPNNDGTVGAIDNSAKLVDLVSKAHANNVKVILSIGGWLTSSPSNTPFETIANSSGAITQFSNTCANLVNQYGLDGIDIDWEYPTSQTKWNNIMNPLATKIHGMGKLLTAAVPDGSYSGNNYGNVAILDLVNIMSYDCGCPTTAPYSEAVSALSYWAGRGVPQNKRILGVPFYSEDNYTALHVQKANYVKTNGGGIMIWDIATYYGDITSIYNTLGSVCKGTVTPPPTCNTVTLPATIQAESFCTMSGVQNETTTDAGGGQNVGYIETNDWMSYSINVPTTGTYTVQYRIASQAGGGSIRLEKLGGGTTFGTITVPSTGGWQTWSTISQTIQLTAGTQSIAIVAATGGFNINWFSITGGGSSPTTTTIQAESYASMSGVQLETTTDAGGGQDVGYTDATDWMLYNNVNIPSSGTYTIEYRVASLSGGGSIQLEKGGGSAVYGSISVPSTGGWQTWTTIKHTVTLTAGVQSFGIKVLAGGFNINWWAFTPGVKSATIQSETKNETTDVILFPNPAKESVTVQTSMTDYSIAVYDLQGKNVISQSHNNGDAQLNTSKLSSGIYIVKVASVGSEGSILKLVIE